jgi:hypothetical protein
VPLPGANATQLSSVIESETGDGGGLIPDELLETLEHQDFDTHISWYAISGAASNKAIHLGALMGNQVLSILLDSGSSIMFINADMLHRIPYSAQKAAPLILKVANGQTIISEEIMTGVEWWIQGHTFSTDARVLHLGAYDMILSMDWLEHHSPMQCDWVSKSIEFNHKGKFITIQRLKPKLVEYIVEIYGEQFLKLHKENDVWALVIMSPMSNSQDQEEKYMMNGIPSPIQEVILDFEYMFQAPSTLPSSRTFDHAISLLLDTVQINYWPYRYSPQQKIEIERQVTNMLQSGIVIPSLNPFAAHELLVKKRWHMEILC